MYYTISHLRCATGETFLKREKVYACTGILETEPAFLGQETRLSLNRKQLSALSLY
jgi:hypothetical protein